MIMKMFIITEMFRMSGYISSVIPFCNHKLQFDLNDDGNVLIEEGSIFFRWEGMPLFNQGWAIPDSLNDTNTIIRN